MHCPIDNTQLAITERQGVEIDYCPECRGVWLDRGELDKLIDKAEVSAAPPVRQTDQYHPEPQHHARPHHKDQYHDSHHYKKKKRESFLGELFDF
jgi:uncharacterized protein